MTAPRSSRLSLLVAAVAAVLLVTTPVAAHQQLLDSSPSSGEVLTVSPVELRLTFNQAVDPALARLSLSGPGGEVLLGPATVGAEEPTVLRAAVGGALAPGEYVISWLVTGDDGHPVRGEIRFTVEGSPAAAVDDTAGGASFDSVGIAPVTGEGATPEAGATPGAPSAGGDGFSSGEPLYGAVRWLTFAAIMTIIGAVVFARLLVPGMLRRSADAPAPELDRARARAATLGLAAAAALAVAAVLRLLAQGAALGGGAFAGADGMLWAMLTRTPWGWGWWLQAAGAVAAGVAFSRARRGGGGGWGVASVAALAVAVTPALSGHAAATSVVAVVTDTLHVLSAGGWLGTLLVTMVAAVPLLVMAGDARTRQAAALISAFSPLALTFAAVLTLTGIYAAWTHLPDLASLGGSGYGRTLLLKIAFLLPALAAGAYNWRRARPALEQRGDARPLRTSATAELVLGALVLAATAALVATPPPAEAHATEVVATVDSAPPVQPGAGR